MSYLLKIRLTWLANMMFIVMVLPLFICALYAHFSGAATNIRTVVEKEGKEPMNVTRINGNIVEYFGDYCNETNIPMLTITHTFTTFTPYKWYFRIGTAFATLYLFIILPTLLVSMFSEKEFVDNSSISRSSIKILAYIAAVAEAIGWIAALVIVYCLDVYYNDERPDLNVLKVPTPTWHWKIHVLCYMTMVAGYTITGITFMLLLFTLENKKVKDKHGYKFKLLLVTITSLCGISSIMYLLADSARCEDQLNFKFAVHEYVFVYGSLYLLSTYPRYYKDKYISLCISSACAHSSDSDEDCHMLKFHPETPSSKDSY